MKNYRETVNSADLVLVEFFASWCPHCQRMMPIVAKLKKDEEGKVAVYQYDVDKYPELTQAENVESYPTFILYRGGNEIWRNSGEMSLDILEEVLDNFA
jgi:thioredoxin 1